MAPRRGARSLKQAAQNSLTRFIFLKEIPAEILNGAPTHLAVAIMIQVTDEIERTNKVAIARGSAMLKQKQCVSVPVMNVGTSLTQSTAAQHCRAPAYRNIARLRESKRHKNMMPLTCMLTTPRSGACSLSPKEA
jgi:hypothetical protein